MRLPFSAGVISDATKIKNSGSCEDLFELTPLLILSDNFADIVTNWTEVDPDNKVNVSSNVLTMDGDGSGFATHGVRSKVAITRRDPTVIEIEHLVDTLINPNSWSLAIVNTNAQPNTATTGTCGIGLTNVSNEYVHLFIALPTQAIVANTWYKLKIYINKSKESTFKKLRFTIQGGIYTTETNLIDTEYTASTELANPFYVAMGRRASNAGSLARWRNYKLYQGLATDAPYVDFVSYAGAGKLHYGLNFTNLALPANVPTNVAPNNLEFAYSYDDGTPSFSGKYTLTTLKALGAIAGNKAYARIRVYGNSNGETQTYIAPINADDAVSGMAALSDITPRVDYLSKTTAITAEGTIIDIYGAGFTGITGTNKIRLNSVAVDTYTIISDTRITITLPALTAEVKSLEIDTVIGGTISKTNVLTVIDGNNTDYQYVEDTRNSLLNTEAADILQGNSVKVKGVTTEGTYAAGAAKVVLLRRVLE